MNDDKILLSGREFTQNEIDDIKYIVKMFKNLTRTEIANTICENFNWFDAKGKNKVSSAAEMLKKLEEQGQIVLPDKKGKGRPKSKGIKVTTRTDAPLKEKHMMKEIEPVAVEIVTSKEQRILWNEYVERYHYLGYKQPFGARQEYFIISGNGEKLGCILLAASAWALEARDKWIGWNEEERIKHLNLIVNNTRFLIFPWVKVKNLASHALSLVSKRVRQDWLLRYGYEPVLLETFVDIEKYLGTCYKAANWIYLGNTTGRGRMDTQNKKTLSQKQIYMYPLVKDFRKYLCSKGRMNNE